MLFSLRSPALDTIAGAITSGTLVRIEAKLDQIIATQAAQAKQLQEILMDEALVAGTLAKIDLATTTIGNNMTAIGTNIGVLGTTADTISTEIDALVAAAKGAGVSQALIDQATAIGAKADALSTAADATKAATDQLVPVLNAIALKGASNPVPIPVPPPPPVIVPPVVAPPGP